MKNKSLIYLLALILAGCSIQTTTRYDGLPDKPIASIPNELRGAWVTRFSWVDADAEIMKQNIISTMKKLADANFNAVFFQVRGQAETLYPSPIEPWSKLFGFKSPGFDPVQLAIEEAHKNGLQFYAYINLLTMWNEDEPPADTSHIYYKYGPNVNMKDTWVSYRKGSTPMDTNKYQYFNPTIPEVKTYLKKVIKHLVVNYDVDGLHFDQFHHRGPHHLKYPKQIEKLRQYNLLEPNWATQLQMDLIEDVLAEAMLVKPYLVNSITYWGQNFNKIEIYAIDAGDYINCIKIYNVDVIEWLDRGIIDFIVPIIYWDSFDAKLNFDKRWNDLKNLINDHKYILPGFKISSKFNSNDTIQNQINFVRENGGIGSVIFAVGPYTDLSTFSTYAYNEKVNLPSNLKRVRPEQVVELDLLNLLLSEKKISQNGAKLIDPGLENEKNKYLLKTEISGQDFRINNINKIETTDAEGKIGIILSTLTDTLYLSSDKRNYVFPTQWWNPPYNYIVNVDGSVSRKSPWVEFRKTPRGETNQASYPFLAKTEYPAKAWINENPVKVNKTGIFFDEVEFEEGANRVEARIEREDSSTVMYVQEFNYIKEDKIRPVFPLWINEKSIQPNKKLTLLDDDIVRVQFMGSKGQEGKVEIVDTDLIFNCTREDRDDFSFYAVEIPLRKLEKGIEHQIKLIVRTTDSSVKDDEFDLITNTTITVKNIDEFPLIKTVKNNSRLTYTLAEIRLGGPMRAEYPPGIILQTSGKVGDSYRVKLSKIDDAYIDADYVEKLPPETLRPKFYISSLFCTPTDSGDIIRIPYYENVPYTIVPEPNQKRILIKLYGVETSSTWLTHKSGRKVIDKVTWQQTTPETYQIIVNLNTSKIWGYDITQSGKNLIFRIKYPPQINPTAENPLKGLKIAIEAGHGGANVGAVGLSGILEKDINLDLSLKLGELCKKMGAEVLQVRDTDRPMYLSTKRDTSRYSGADIHISIHANSGGSRGGYLGVSGTSHYYHNPFWAPLAEMIHNNVLEMDIDEFGVVGSFNYTVTRMTEMPAILVEQAFMSNAEDEEKLADENFRQEMAEKIFEGIVEYVNFMSSE